MFPGFMQKFGGFFFSFKQNIQFAPQFFTANAFSPIFMRKYIIKAMTR